MRMRRATSGTGAAGVAVLSALLGAGSFARAAGAPPAHATPRPERLRPGVDTSKSAPGGGAPVTEQRRRAPLRPERAGGPAAPAPQPAASARAAGRQGRRGGAGCGQKGCGPSGTGSNGRQR